MKYYVRFTRNSACQSAFICKVFNLMLVAWSAVDDPIALIDVPVEVSSVVATDGAAAVPLEVSL